MIFSKEPIAKNDAQGAPNQPLIQILRLFYIQGASLRGNPPLVPREKPRNHKFRQTHHDRGRATVAVQGQGLASARNCLGAVARGTRSRKSGKSGFGKLNQNRKAHKPASRSQPPLIIVSVSRVSIWYSVVLLSPVLRNLTSYCKTFKHVPICLWTCGHKAALAARQEQERKQVHDDYIFWLLESLKERGRTLTRKTAKSELNAFRILLNDGTGVRQRLPSEN